MINIDINSKDILFDDVVKAIKETGYASTSFFQRKFKLGYARAARIIDQLEEAKIIGKSTGAGLARKILIPHNKPKKIDFVEEPTIFDRIETKLDQLLFCLDWSNIKTGTDCAYYHVLNWLKGKDTITGDQIVKQFQVGYARAGRIIDTLEKEGYIAPKVGKSEKRKVING